MSNDLARARARKAAGEWVNGQWPNGESHFNRDALILAFEAGLEHCADEHTITVATGQRQLDDGASLMREAVDLFRSYEKHHAEKVMSLIMQTPDVAHLAVEQIEAAKRKVGVNALMAARLEAWLSGADQYPTSLQFEYSDGSASRIELPGAMRVADQAVQEAFVSAALDAGIAQITEADEPPFADRTLADCKAKFANTAENFAGFARGGVVTKGPSGDVPAILQRGEERRRLPETRDQPVEISAIMAPPLRDGDLTMAKDAPADLSILRQSQCMNAGFTYWPGGDGPPADLDEEGEVLLDWGEQTESGPRFTICGVEELTPMPGLWAESIDLESFATIIGYGSSGKVLADFATPADAAAVGLKPADLIAAEPDPRAALVHARKWLSSAEDLIMLAADHIRGVTGANPGSDSEEICQRLDAWLAPMATPAAPTAEEN